MKTRLVALICLMALLLTALPAAALAETAEPIEAGIRGINKYGNLVLTISATGLLARGYEYGDIAAVTIDGQTYDVPVVSTTPTWTTARCSSASLPRTTPMRTSSCSRST